MTPPNAFICILIFAFVATCGLFIGFEQRAKYRRAQKLKPKQDDRPFYSGGTPL